MKPILKKLIGYSMSAALPAVVLAGCTTIPAAHSPNECVGPPGYCVPYFGS